MNENDITLYHKVIIWEKLFGLVDVLLPPCGIMKTYRKRLMEKSEIGTGETLNNLRKCIVRVCGFDFASILHNLRSERKKKWRKIFTFCVPISDWMLPEFITIVGYNYYLLVTSLIEIWACRTHGTCIKMIQLQFT